MAPRVGYRFEPDVVPAPGETMKELLEQRGMPQADFALRIGRTEKNISQLINGKAPITPETAIDLERVLGVPAEFWNHAEARYRDWLARAQQQTRLNQQAEWAGEFPLKEMESNGWIARETSPSEQSAELLRFFGVASSDSWAEYWGSPKRLAARMSRAFDPDTVALTAWLRQGEIEAQSLATAPYDEATFKTTLGELRGATRLAPEQWQSALRERCAASGVAVALVREIPKIRCYAVSWWMNSQKAVIQLCLRQGGDDQFWFSFFHEAAHLLKHGRRHAHIHDIDGDPRLEDEADRFAADLLVPRKSYEEFVAGRKPTKAQVIAFAERVGVAPSIVVGRLQHDEIIPFSQMNDLKTKLHWAALP